MSNQSSISSIESFLERDQNKDLLRLLTAGSVDDGKSTLIGRLLFDTKKIYEDQLAALERDNLREGHAENDTDYALLLDGLKAEREQGITIDVAYRYFSTNKRKFIIADTPGHEQYTRNMVTGASTANLAIILVDARTGIITQTKRHTFLASLLGIKHVVLAVNKMDLMGFKQEVFDKICSDYKDFVTRLNIPDVHCIPLSALKGDNVVDHSTKMPWYDGKTLLHFLETVHISSDQNFIDLRYPVQYVLRPSQGYRGFAAKVAAGIIRKGDEVMVLPSKKKSKVSSITTYDGELDMAFPPLSVAVTLEDEIDISRGDMLVHPNNVPKVERHFEAMLVWMSENDMEPNTNYIIKHTTHSTKAKIDKIRYHVDVNTLNKSDKDIFGLNDIGRAVLTTNKPLYFDPYQKNKTTGSFILIDPVSFNTVAVGMIIDRVSAEDLPSKITGAKIGKSSHGKSLITDEERAKRYGQKGATIWIMGCHGSGKNQIAYKLEHELFERGATTVLIDGSIVRAGLSSELDYSPVDRAEHLRRVAYMCQLLNDQGLITICTFISPSEDIRSQVAEIIGNDRFHLVYINAEESLCKAQEPELYKKAEKGEIQFVPGVDISFEEPENPALKINQTESDIDPTSIISFLEAKGIFPLH